MRMNRMAALALSAGMITMAACSDSPTAPTSKVKQIGLGTPSFAVGDVTDGPAPAAEVGKIVLCKVGNIAGSFDFTETPEGPDQDPTGSVADDQTLENGKCLEVANDFSPDGSGNQVQIHELDAVDPANTVQEIVSCRFISKNTDGSLNAEEDCEVYADNQKLFLNAFHGFVVTYKNTFTEPPPPPTGCTYTKGWYQSKNAVITGVDGLSTDVEADFFAAQPKKTGDVSFVGPNNLLNLYQQLLAALENGGEGGPAAVQQAISDAQAGTTVTGTVLTTSLSSTEISNLISTLSSFNEGSFTGWPHCGDEIIVS